MQIELNILDQIRQDWKTAPRGYKSKIVAKWSETLGYSYNSLYGLLNAGRKRKKGERKIGCIEDYVRIVFQIKKKVPEQHGEISTDQAVRIAIENNIIPANMINKISTINRIGRELALNKKIRRVSRFQASYPNELHHVDASSSKFFYIARELAGGDCLLKLHAGKKGYKNKPVPTRLRPWVYGLVDDHSGYYVGRYIAAYGETAIDNLNFLAWAWSKNDAKPFFGLPEKLKGDLGPMMRGKDAQDFFKRLGVEVDPSEPENKEAHGKIERPWRTIWQRFEKTFFAQTDWKKFEVTVSEFNRQFFIYQEEYNSMSHRFEKNITRYQAWKRINFRGGAVAMPERALTTVAKRIERTIGADGCFSFNGQQYEVKGLHNAKVFIYMGVFDDRLVVEDKESGRKYEVEKFTPNPVGTFTSREETPHQKAVKAGETLQLENTLYTTPKDQGNVTHFPARIKETRDIKDPLDVDTYPSLNEAMQDFISISGELPKGKDSKDLKKLIIKNGLNRSFVRNLAFEVQAENERRELYG